MQATVSDAAEPAETAARDIVVAAVPTRHPYVQRVSSATGIRLADEPTPAHGDPTRWWPPAALDPSWISAHAAEADLLHVHFGTESFPPGHLSACIAAAHDAGWPVVFTIHDLEHPQLSDQRSYASQLDELVVGADALIALTPGAARVVRDRWDRDALVVPHPSLLPADAVIPDILPSEDRRVGVHLKDLRPNVDGPAAARAVIDTVAALRSEGIRATGEVRLHHHVREAVARDEVRALCAGAPFVSLVEHERLSDPELVVALSRWDACVLPYRWGTHSGWLELCWDLGVPVAAPDTGFYAEQHTDASVDSFALDDSTSLRAAVTRLWAGPDATRAAGAERRELIARRRRERRRTDVAAAAAHAHLYRSLTERRA